jgi:hypothetical protein
MKNILNSSYTNRPCILSLPELSLIHNQLTEWADLKTPLKSTYKQIMNLSISSSGKIKKMFENKNDKEYVFLKEYSVEQDPNELCCFIKEMFMGLFMRNQGLLTCSKYFSHKKVRVINRIIEIVQI